MGKAVVFSEYWKFHQFCDEDFMSNPHVGVGELGPVPENFM